MNQIQLHFTDSLSPELSEVIFKRDSEEQVYHSVRGKVSGLVDSNRSFQWTPAVKALSVLLLSSNLSESLSPEIGIGVLSGEQGSLASTLDYAISKQPAWITDIFGTYNGGNCYLRKLVTRTNAERKHPGPVVLKINSIYLPTDKILVFQNNQQLFTKEILSLLHILIQNSQTKNQASIKTEDLSNPVNARQKLELESSRSRICSVAEFIEHQSSLGPLPAPFADPEWNTGLRNIYRRELLEVLTSSDIFSKSGRNRILNHLTELSPLSKILGSQKILFFDIDLEIAGLSRLGISEDFPWLREKLLSKPPLTISLASVHVGAIAIAKSLRNLKGFNVQVSHDFPHSTDLVKRVLSSQRDESPDLFCVNLATAAWFINQDKPNGYIPYMLMPMFSQRVQAPKRNKSKSALQGGEFHFMAEIPTSAYLYFEELATQGVIQKRKTSVCETDLLEIPALLESGDSDARIISPFPLYKFYETYDVEYLDTPLQSRDFGYRSTIMFVKEELKSDVRLLKVLNYAIRDTWLELVENEFLLEQALDLLISDRSYVRAISRMAGLKFIASANSRMPEVARNWNTPMDFDLKKKLVS